MITCLPFLVGLILYSGLIIMHIFDLLHRKIVTSNCTDEINQTIRTKSNVCGIISGIVLISIIYFLCKYKHEKIAWAVILTPIIMAFILFLTLLYKIQEITTEQINDSTLRAGV